MSVPHIDTQGLVVCPDARMHERMQETGWPLSQQPTPVRIGWSWNAGCNEGGLTLVQNYCTGPPNSGAASGRPPQL